MNDLYKINLKTFRSKKCQIEDGSLTRAMHKMVIFENNIFLFGGLTENDSISDDLFKLSPIEGSNRFTKSKVEFETKPTPRIAFNFHIINLPIRKACEYNKVVCVFRMIVVSIIRYSDQIIIRKTQPTLQFGTL